MEDLLDYSISELRAALMVKERKHHVSFPAEIWPVLDQYSTRKQEHFLVVLLDGSNNVMCTKVVSKGLVNRCLVHPREVFRPAIVKNAVSVILAHNHPSGNPEPSSEDFAITERLKDAGEIIGIHVVDHIIISTYGMHSMVEKGEF